MLLVNGHIGSMARFCNDISPLLSQVNSLQIHGGSRPQMESQNDMEPTQWLKFFHPFTAVEHLSVSHSLVPVVAHALRELTGEKAAEAFPVLRSLSFEGYRRSESIHQAEPFLIARRLSNRPVALV